MAASASEPTHAKKTRKRCPAGNNWTSLSGLFRCGESVNNFVPPRACVREAVAEFRLQWRSLNKSRVWYNTLFFVVHTLNYLCFFFFFHYNSATASLLELRYRYALALRFATGF